MKRLVISLALALVLVFIPASAVLAATTQDVTVTATPTYISISNTPTARAFGIVTDTTDYWSSGSAPVWDLDDAECYFTVTNDGSVTENISVTGANFTGGVGWTLAGTPAADTVTIKVGKSGDVEANMVTLTTSAQSFISNLAAAGTMKWELKMETPTSFSDGVEKQGVITLTATQA